MGSQIGMGGEQRSGKRRRCRLVILGDAVEQIVVILHQHPVDRAGCTQGRNWRFVVGCEDGNAAKSQSEGRPGLLGCHLFVVLERRVVRRLDVSRGGGEILVLAVGEPCNRCGPEALKSDDAVG